MDYFDAAVVGGGPTGLMAARKIAERGFKVALFEKDSDVGKKVCGEACSEASITDAEISGERKFLLNRISCVYIYPPDETKPIEIQREIETIGTGYILDKHGFLKALASEAEKRGASLFFNSHVHDAERSSHQVTVKISEQGHERQVRSKILLGCDGFNSIIRKKFFDPQKIELISCIQYTMTDCNVPDQHVMEFFFGKQVAPLGYLWFFPKSSGVVNLGVGVRGSTAKDFLEKFIRRHPERLSEAQVQSVGGAPVIVSGQIEKFVTDNILLSGESAGQVIPFTGAGIHTGLVSGKIAAQTVIEALESEDFSEKRLTAYVERFNRAYGDRIKKSLRAMRVFERLDDEYLNQLAEILTGEDVINLANGQNIERVAKKLLSHPALALRVAKALVR
ncbi:NAD(P)/FAD-dependent oxidoreductase [[Eubacterium] cellulosolvens]